MCLGVRSRNCEGERKPGLAVTVMVSPVSCVLSQKLSCIYKIIDSALEIFCDFCHNSIFFFYCSTISDSSPNQC